MQILSNKEPIGRFVLAAVALGLMLLAIATSTARAETAPEAALPPTPPTPAGVELAATGTAASVPVAATPVPVSAAVETPPPATTSGEAAEGPSTPLADSAADPADAVPTPSSSPVPSSPPAPSQTVPSASDVVSTARSIEHAAVSATTSRASELAESARRNSTEAVMPLVDPEAPTSVPTAVAHLQSAPEVLRQTPGFEQVLEEVPGAERIFEVARTAAAEAIRPIGAIADLASSALAELPLAIEVPASPAALGPTQPAGIQVTVSGGNGGHLAGTPLAGTGETGLAGLRTMSTYSAAVDRGPSKLQLPAGLEDLHVVHLATAASGGVGFESAIERSGNRTPFAPIPQPGSPEAAAGPGSIFVPIVALLALLALAAPAIGRRLGEAADFRAPVPFVCALERPG